MRQKIVLVDIETGGLGHQPVIHDAFYIHSLKKWGKDPKPSFEMQFTGNDRVFHFTPPAPIIQIAAVAAYQDELEEIDSYQIKLRLRVGLCDPESLKMNSFDPLLWIRDEVSLRIGLQDFSSWLKSHATVQMTSKANRPYYVARVGGHNFRSFDLQHLLYSFSDPEWQGYALPTDLPRMCPPEGIFFPGMFLGLDTLDLAIWWQFMTGADIENLKLETLAKYFGVEMPDAHDALVDVRANLPVMKALLAGVRRHGI